MATFTQEELDFIKAHGNEECSKTWLGLLADPKARGRQQPSQDYREHIIDKYEKQRYFLSPASPLKTIGAATGLRNGAGGVSLSSSSGTVTSPSSPSSASSVNSSAAANADQNNNNNVIQQNQLNLKAIQLTPPASTRTSGRHHQQQPNNNNSLNNNNSNSNISRGGFNGSSAFAEDSLFSEASTKQQQQQQWTNLNSNQGSLFGTANNNNNNNIISNGFKSNTNNINNNSFGAFGQGSGSTGAAMAPPGQHMTATSTSGGFVADFGSADIFNANVINGGTNNNNNKSNNNNNINGGLVMMNGHGERTEGGALNRSNAVKRRNGSLTAGEQQAITHNGFSNGTTATMAVAGQKKPEENFADFDHNPIFNSAGE